MSRWPDQSVDNMATEPKVTRMTYNFTDQLRLLHGSKFTDFEIRCGEHTFKAHRFVICSQSPYFRALAGGDFKEATDQATTLPDEEPSLLVRYLIYLYSSSYPEAKLSDLDSSSQFRSVKDEYGASKDRFQICMLHARMYCFARRRCDERLEKFCLQEFSRNYWAKRPRQSIDKHTLTPRGPTRTLKYHMGKYTRDMEETLIVGTKNTHAEVFDLLADFADWSDISINQKRVRGADGFPPGYRGRRNVDDVWEENTNKLQDFDFDHQHLVVGRTPNSNAKNLSLLSCIDRWQSKVLSTEEQDLVRYVLTVTTEYGTPLKDMIALDLIMRKHASSLVPDASYRIFQREFSEFFLDLDNLVKPQERRQCKTCFSIQPVVRQPCSCGKYSDSCDKNCLSKQLDELMCFCCMSVGTMKLLEDKTAQPRGGGRDDVPVFIPQAVYVDDDMSD